jgi:hypothetical protein
MAAGCLSSEVSMATVKDAQTLVSRNVRSRIMDCYGLCGIAETEVYAG